MGSFYIYMNTKAKKIWEFLSVSDRVDKLHKLEGKIFNKIDPGTLRTISNTNWDELDNIWKEGFEVIAKWEYDVISAQSDFISWNEENYGN